MKIHSTKPKRMFVEDDLNSQQKSSRANDILANEVVSVDNLSNSTHFADNNKYKLEILRLKQIIKQLKQDFYLNKQPKGMINLMQIAKDEGKKETLKRIVKLFDYEIHNNFVSFETLKELVELKEELECLKN